MAQTKKTHQITVKVQGKEYTLAEACKVYNISYNKAYKRLTLKWQPERIFEVTANV